LAFGLPEDEKTVTKPIPITRPTLPDLHEIEPQIRSILKTGQLTNGRYVQQFESEFARKFDCKQAVAMSSCTDGLTWVLKYLPAGEIVLPSFTFSATAHAAVLAGHHPVFSDCDPKTLNLDPIDAGKRITGKTRAILATYIYGNPPNIKALQQLARKHRVKLILDAAHAVGSRYRGTPAGNFGWAEVFSLTPTKQLCCGEGGMVTTGDTRLVKFLRMARNYGNPGNYNTKFVGSNIRLEEFNAILGLAGLSRIDEFIKLRNRLANLYRSELADVPGVRFPVVHPDDVCSFKDFTILLDSRKAPLSRFQLEERLRQENIETRRYFDPPVHRHTAYRRLVGSASGNLPHTDNAARQCLSLPMYSHLTAGEVRRIAGTILREAKA
jgi:dTDP-4-amino-4,6-dideoxygalactose transaminase